MQLLHRFRWRRLGHSKRTEFMKTTCCPIWSPSPLSIKSCHSFAFISVFIMNADWRSFITPSQEAHDLRLAATYCLSWLTNFNNHMQTVDGNTHNFAFSVAELLKIRLKIDDTSRWSWDLIDYDIMYKNIRTIWATVFAATQVTFFGAIGWS